MDGVPDAHSHVATVWGQAAAKVAGLRRDDGEPGAVSWNEAIARAVTALEQEADDIRAMGRMAHLLTVGNVPPANRC